MANGLMEYDLVINNGKLVIPPDIISSSIGVKGEKIAAIATDLSGFPTKKTIDAKGNYVLPGVVDPETHLWDIGSRRKRLVSMASMTAPSTSEWSMSDGWVLPASPVFIRKTGKLSVSFKRV